MREANHAERCLMDAADLLGALSADELTDAAHGLEQMVASEKIPGSIRQALAHLLFAVDDALDGRSAESWSSLRAV